MSCYYAYSLHQVNDVISDVSDVASEITKLVMSQVKSPSSSSEPAVLKKELEEMKRKFRAEDKNDCRKKLLERRLKAVGGERRAGSYCAIRSSVEHTAIQACRPTDGPRECSKNTANSKGPHTRLDERIKDFQILKSHTSHSFP